MTLDADCSKIQETLPSVLYQLLMGISFELNINENFD